MHLPVHTSSTADYVASHKFRMLRLLAVQTFVCAARLWVVWDVWGGFVMALSLALGYYTVREGMHITLLCVWGLVNAYEAAWDSVSGLVSFAFFLLDMAFMQCFFTVVTPIVEIAATQLAWEVLKGHVLRGGFLAPILGEDASKEEPVHDR
mmetsp:Transcript_67404/g.156484  ORF Transcript_67404/g.156484 Transcript_67404/m.156484 type:complete len:151 (-) Transcript_67404:55-507(-)